MRFATRFMCGKKEWKCSECQEWFEHGAMPKDDFICFQCLGLRDPKGIIVPDTTPTANAVEPAAAAAELKEAELLLTSTDILVLESIVSTVHFHNALFMKPAIHYSTAVSGNAIITVKHKIIALCDKLREEGAFDVVK